MPRLQRGAGESTCPAQLARVEESPGCLQEISTGDSIAQSIRSALHAYVLQFLDAEGVSTPLLKQLYSELAESNSKEVVCSNLMKIFQYASTGSLEIVASSLNGCNHRFAVKAWTTISEVKSMLAERTSIPVSAQRLVHRTSNKVLESDEISLAECNVNPFHPEILVVGVARFAVSNSNENTLRLWDLATGTCLQTLRGHSGKVWCFDVHWKNMQAVTASADHTLRIWDLHSGKGVIAVKEHWAVVRSLAVDWANLRALTGSVGGTIELWDLQKGCCECTHEIHSGTVYGLSVDWSGGKTLSVSADKTLKFSQLGSETCIRTLCGHTDSVKALAVDWKSHLVLTGSEDRSLVLWDLSTDEDCKVGMCKGQGAITSVVAKWAAMFAITGSLDMTLRIWDLQSTVCVQTLEGHYSAVFAVDVDWEASKALSGDGNGTLKIWDLKIGRCIQTIEGTESGLSAVALSSPKAITSRKTGQAG